MLERCSYVPSDMQDAPAHWRLRCGKEAGHDGQHHLLQVSEDGRSAWIYVEDDMRPLEAGMHLDMRPGPVDDEMAIALVAMAELMGARADRSVG